MKKAISSPSDTPHPFVAKHQADVIGMLQGFDRLRLQGTLRALYFPEIMEEYLWKAKVLWKDFKSFATGLTQRMRGAVEALAIEAQRPVLYLPSSQTRKDMLAKEIAQRDGVEQGIVAVLSCVEACRAYRAVGNRQSRKLQLRLQESRCTHLYVYLIDEVLGWVHLRLQTWFPFLIQICLNGREWLARRLSQEGIGFRRVDNALPWIEDVARAQQLMDEQLRTDWPRLCQRLVADCHPLQSEILTPLSLSYYWTVAESEYASDVMFRDRAHLERIYPALVRFGMQGLHCEQVLRYLGCRRPEIFAGEVQSDSRRRREGIRLKHWVNRNSLKMYDKGSILRVEATINDPSEFKVYRAPESKPDAPKRWRVLRRSTADTYRRARVSQAATERYLEAMSSVDAGLTLGQQAQGLCRPLRKGAKRYRALNPFAPDDARLLSAICAGEFLIQGFRNRDLRLALFAHAPSKLQQRRQSAAITRKLALLRAHRLIAKVPKSHRYHVTPRGRRLISALQAADKADLEQLLKIAA
jgi:hypothetical protein